MDISAASSLVSPTKTTAPKFKSFPVSVPFEHTYGSNPEQVRTAGVLDHTPLDAALRGNPRHYSDHLIEEAMKEHGTERFDRPAARESGATGSYRSPHDEYSSAHVQQEPASFTSNIDPSSQVGNGGRMFGPRDNSVQDQRLARTLYRQRSRWLDTTQQNMQDIPPVQQLTKFNLEAVGGTTPVSRGTATATTEAACQTCCDVAVQTESVDSEEHANLRTEMEALRATNATLMDENKLLRAQLDERAAPAERAAPPIDRIQMEPSVSEQILKLSEPSFPTPSLSRLDELERLIQAEHAKMTGVKPPSSGAVLHSAADAMAMPAVQERATAAVLQSTHEEWLASLRQQQEESAWLNQQQWQPTDGTNGPSMVPPSVGSPATQQLAAKLQQYPPRNFAAEAIGDVRYQPPDGASASIAHQNDGNPTPLGQDGGWNNGDMSDVLLNDSGAATSYAARLLEQRMRTEMAQIESLAGVSAPAPAAVQPTPPTASSMFDDQGRWQHGDVASFSSISVASLRQADPELQRLLAQYSIPPLPTSTTATPPTSGVPAGGRSPSRFCR